MKASSCYPASAWLFLLSAIASSQASAQNGPSPAAPKATPVAGGAAPAPSPDDLQNPQLLGRNKLPGHAEMIAFPTADAALRNADIRRPAADRRRSSTWVLDLNGRWKFAWSASADQRPRDFAKIEFDDRTWKAIPVPSCVELQGYGAPIYVENLTDDAHTPWGKLDAPHIPAAKNPVSSYRRIFTPPAAWKGQRAVLHFDGVASAFYVWLNGKPIGFSKGSGAGAEFDITSAMLEGPNTLAVEVYRYSDGSYLEDQSQWRLSGIFRDVYVESFPSIHLADAFVKAGLDATYANGALSIQAKVRNEGDATTQTQAQMELFDDKGKPVWKTTIKKPLAARAETLFDSTGASQSIPGVHAWSAEDPYLYTLVIGLKSPSGKDIEAAPFKIGFRTSEVKDGRLLVNGKPILIKGVNFTESDPDAGLAVTRQMMGRDLEMMKQANINAVRVQSPAGPEWYALCDLYGIYVFDEPDLASFSNAAGKAKSLAANPEWKAAYLDRAERLFQRDKNHASVIAWSLGADGDEGPNLEANYAFLKKNDPTRPVDHVSSNDSSLADIYSPTYLSAEDMRKYAASKPAKPLILGAFARSAGNSTGGLAETWAAVQSSPFLQGGFIEDWADQGLRKRDKDGAEFFAFAGDYPGDIPFDRNSSCSGLVNPDRNPHPALADVRKVYQSIKFEPVDLASGKVRITNQNAFSGTERLTFAWQISVDGKSVQSGIMNNLGIKAGESKEAVLAFKPVSLAPGQEAFLLVVFDLSSPTIWGKFGTTIATEQFPLAVKPSPAPAAVKAAETPAPKAALKADETQGSLGVHGDDFDLLVGKATGSIESWIRGGHKMLLMPLSPDFWRVPTDNDIASSATLPSQAIWKSAATARKIESAAFLPGSNVDAATIRVKGTMLDGKCPFTIDYRIVRSGAIHVRLSINPDPSLPPLPRVGMEAAFPGSMDRIQYFGRGPTENYWDRKSGSTVGLYNASADSLGFPYVRPQENGNRTDVRWMAFSDGAVNAIIVLHGSNMLNVTAHPYSQADLADAKHNNEIPRRNAVSVQIDGFLQGVGGDAAVGPRARPRPEYQLPPKEYAFDFALVPVDLPKTNEKVDFDALALASLQAAK